LNSAHPFYGNVRVFAITNPSVVCDVGAPYSGVETFGNFFAVLYLSDPLISAQDYTEIVPGDPSFGAVNVRGV